MENSLSLEQQQAIAMAQARKRKAMSMQTKTPKDEGYIPEQAGVKDYARTGFDQALQGATFGFSDEISDRVGALIASQFTGIPYSEMLKEARTTTKARLDEQLQELPVTSIAANVAGGLLTGGAGATTKTGTAVGNSLRTGSTAARVGKGAVAGATSGAAYGAGTAEEGERIKGAESGAILGGALGAAVPAIAGAGSAVKQTVLPKVDDVLKPLAQTAVEKYKIPLSRAQIGEGDFAKTLESTAKEIPLSGSNKFFRKQQDAFNRAISNTIGEDADRITPEIIKKAYTNIGKKFDDALKGTVMRVSNEYKQSLDNILMDAQDTVTEETRKIIERNYMNALKDVAEDGTVNGEKLSSLRSLLVKRIAKTRNDATPYLKEIVTAIDDELIRNAPQEVAENLKTARLQYKNLKTIEPLVKKASLQAVKGDVSPSALMTRVAGNFSDFSKGGGGDLGDLARIGQAFLKDAVPNSGSPKRLAAYTAFFGGPATVFGGLDAGLTGLATGATGIGAAQGFNSLNTSQKLVLNALKGKTLTLPNTRGVLTGNAADKLKGK